MVGFIHLQIQLRLILRLIERYRKKKGKYGRQTEREKEIERERERERGRGEREIMIYLLRYLPGSILTVGIIISFCSLSCFLLFLLFLVFSSLLLCFFFPNKHILVIRESQIWCPDWLPQRANSKNSAFKIVE